MEITVDNIRTIIDLMPGNVVAYEMEDNEPIIVYCSKGIPALFGYNEEEYDNIKITNMFDWVLDEDKEVITNRVQGCIEEENKSLDLLYRVKHKEKGFVWVHMTSNKLGILDNKIVFLATIVDVTKEMLNSYALMEASDRYICVIEKPTKMLLYANEIFYQLIGLTAAESMGKHCYEVLCGVLEMRDNDNCLCYSSINAEKPIETYNPVNGKYLQLTGREIVWGEYDAYVFYMTDITEVKLKDEQLKDSQKRFEVALANSDLMIWEYDIVNSLCINSNKAGKDYDIPLIIENYPEALYETGHVPPETIEQIKDVKRRLLNGETGFSVERRTIDKYGQSQWQKVDYTLECDENGKPLRAIVCGLDINAQKELERKYEEQMDYRNNLAKSAMLSIRLDLEADTISDYTCNEKGWEPIIASSKSANDFFSSFFKQAYFEEDSELNRDRLNISYLKEAYTLGRSQYHIVYQCSLLSQYIDMNLTLYKNPGTNHLEAFFVNSDVTENVLMHSAFQSVVSKDYDYVAVVNIKTGNTIFMAQNDDEFMLEPESNKHYNDLISSFVDNNKSKFYTPDDYLMSRQASQLDYLIEKLETVPVYEFNYKAKITDDVITTYRMSFCYSDTTKSQIIMTRTNITNAVLEEQKNQEVLEQALKTARQANLAKTDFLSRMSHDMRTPMNGIIGMTRLTQDIPELPKEVQSNLSAIEDSSNYLLKLINDTLDMSKIESNKFTLNPEVINVGEVIENIIAIVMPLAKNKQIKLECVPINAQMEYIFADKIRIQQICLNVLSNSIKFTPSGGRIRMEIECLKRDGDVAYDRISVEDTGCGMSKEFLKHIFEPFTQESNKIVSGQEGTGLGMAIVKNLVELMGGRVEIESKKGKGTKVTAYMNFKRVYNVPDKDTKQLLGKKSQLENKRVLLVEDHPLNATIAKRLLEKRGMIVEHAENGLIGVQMFTAAKQNYYDCVLMDIRMPEMDGLEATRQIRAMEREDAKTTPIIAMTANAYVEDVQATARAGMNSHLAKPVKPEELYGELEKFL